MRLCRETQISRVADDVRPRAEALVINRSEIKNDNSMSNGGNQWQSGVIMSLLNDVQ